MAGLIVLIGSCRMKLVVLQEKATSTHSGSYKHCVLLLLLLFFIAFNRRALQSFHHLSLLIELTGHIIGILIKGEPGVPGHALLSQALFHPDGIKGEIIIGRDPEGVFEGFRDDGMGRTRSLLRVIAP